MSNKLKSKIGAYRLQLCAVFKSNKVLLICFATAAFLGIISALVGAKSFSSDKQPFDLLSSLKSGDFNFFLCAVWYALYFAVLYATLFVLPYNFLLLAADFPIIFFLSKFAFIRVFAPCFSCGISAITCVVLLYIPIAAVTFVCYYILLSRFYSLAGYTLAKRRPLCIYPIRKQASIIIKFFAINTSIAVAYFSIFALIAKIAVK